MAGRVRPVQLAAGAAVLAAALCGGFGLEAAQAFVIGDARLMIAPRWPVATAVLGVAGIALVLAGVWWGRGRRRARAELAEHQRTSGAVVDDGARLIAHFDDDPTPTLEVDVSSIATVIRWRRALAPRAGGPADEGLPPPTASYGPTARVLQANAAALQFFRCADVDALRAAATTIFTTDVWAALTPLLAREGAREPVLCEAVVRDMWGVYTPTVLSARPVRGAGDARDVIVMTFALDERPVSAVVAPPALGVTAASRRAQASA